MNTKFKISYFLFDHRFPKSILLGYIYVKDSEFGAGYLSLFLLFFILDIRFWKEKKFNPDDYGLY